MSLQRPIYLLCAALLLLLVSPVRLRAADCPHAYETAEFAARAGSPKACQERFCVLQVRRVEALGKAAAYGSEKVAGLVSPSLGAQKARQADRGAQFEAACALPPRDGESQTARSLHLRPIGGRQAAEQSAAQPM